MPFRRAGVLSSSAGEPIRFVFTGHAERNMQRRGVSREVARELLEERYETTETESHEIRPRGNSD